MIFNNYILILLLLGSLSLQAEPVILANLARCDKILDSKSLFSNHDCIAKTLIDEFNTNVKDFTRKLDDSYLFQKKQSSKIYLSPDFIGCTNSDSEKKTNSSVVLRPVAKINLVSAENSITKTWYGCNLFEPVFTEKLTTQKNVVGEDIWANFFSPSQRKSTYQVFDKSGTRELFKIKRTNTPDDMITLFYINGNLLIDLYTQLDSQTKKAKVTTISVPEKMSFKSDYMSYERERIYNYSLKVYGHGDNAELRQTTKYHPIPKNDFEIQFNENMRTPVKKTFLKTFQNFTLRFPKTQNFESASSLTRFQRDFELTLRQLRNVKGAEDDPAFSKIEKFFKLTKSALESKELKIEDTRPLD